MHTKGTLLITINKYLGCPTIVILHNTCSKSQRLSKNVSKQMTWNKVPLNLFAFRANNFNWRETRPPPLAQDHSRQARTRWTPNYTELTEPDSIVPTTQLTISRPKYWLIQNQWSTNSTTSDAEQTILTRTFWRERRLQPAPASPPETYFSGSASHFSCILQQQKSEHVSCGTHGQALGGDGLILRWWRLLSGHHSI